MEQKEGDSIIISSDSAIFPEEEEKRGNDFDTKVFEEKILPKNSQEDKNNKNNKKNIMKELEDILVCCICYNYLDNPVNDPSCCPHYACRICFEKYFIQKKSNIIPCPLCRKYIKKENLVKIPLIDTIKEIIKEAEKNNINEDININIEE